MGQAQQQIEDMVVAIFCNRQNAELQAASREVAEAQSDHARRGMVLSGSYVIAVTRAFESAVIRTVERTLEDLALQFRQAGRRDPVLFWNLVEPKLHDLTLGFSSSAMATAVDRLQTIGTSAGMIARVGEQSWATVQQLLRSRVHELRVKSQFITMKTADDRRANGVPDVAVMMWFPDPRTDKAEDVEAAKQRYEAIQSAVNKASNGQATVNKIDDPSVIPQDRISASIEVWLEKAVVVICDLAGQRHNVYYEFGYTRAVGTDVLLTCPQADADKTKLHLGHWQRLEYSNLNELNDKLVDKLKVVLPKYDLSGTI